MKVACFVNVPNSLAVKHERAILGKLKVRHWRSQWHPTESLFICWHRTVSQWSDDLLDRLDLHKLRLVKRLILLVELQFLLFPVT